MGVAVGLGWELEEWVLVGEEDLVGEMWLLVVDDPVCLVDECSAVEGME